MRLNISGSARSERGPKSLRLRSSRVGKMNLVDALLPLDDELSATERQMFADKLPSGFHPLTAVERETWLRKRRSLCFAPLSFRSETISTVHFAAT
jgi:hypothetical protein